MIIFDADAVTYLCSKDDLETSLKATDNLLKSVFKYLQMDAYYMFLSGKPYYRCDIDPGYKAQRKPSATLHFLKEIHNYLIDEYGAKKYSPFEADDLVAFAKKRFSYSTVVSTDKDVLKTIPGPWFNYKSFSRGFTTESEALKFLYVQCLMGDSADNIKGVPGIGEVKATKLIQPLATEEEMIATCIETYKSKYEDEQVAISEFQKNFQLVKLLSEDFDYIKYGGFIPDIGDPLIYTL